MFQLSYHRCKTAEIKYGVLFQCFIVAFISLKSHFSRISSCELQVFQFIFTNDSCMKDLERYIFLLKFNTTTVFCLETPWFCDFEDIFHTTLRFINVFFVISWSGIFWEYQTLTRCDFYIRNNLATLFIFSRDLITSSRLDVTM